MHVCLCLRVCMFIYMGVYMLIHAHGGQKSKYHYLGAIHHAF